MTFLPEDRKKQRVETLAQAKKTWNDYFSSVFGHKQEKKFSINGKILLKVIYHDSLLVAVYKSGDKKKSLDTDGAVLEQCLEDIQAAFKEIVQRELHDTSSLKKIVVYLHNRGSFTGGHVQALATPYKAVFSLNFEFYFNTIYEMNNSARYMLGLFGHEFSHYIDIENGIRMVHYATYLKDNPQASLYNLLLSFFLFRCRSEAFAIFFENYYANRRSFEIEDRRVVENSLETVIAVVRLAKDWENGLQLMQKENDKAERKVKEYEVGQFMMNIIGLYFIKKLKQLGGVSSLTIGFAAGKSTVSFSEFKKRYNNNEHMFVHFESKNAEEVLKIIKNELLGLNYQEFLELYEIASKNLGLRPVFTLKKYKKAQSDLYLYHKAQEKKLAED